MGNTLSDGFNKLFNIFSNNKEQKMKEGYTSMVHRYMTGITNSISSKLNSEVNAFDKMQYEESRNYMLELAAQRENALSDNLMDYIINNPDDNNSSIEKVYNELHQKNNDNMRKTEIKTYMSKLYSEYTYKTVF